MTNLPEVPFDVYRLETGKADNYGKIHYENKTYSSSPEYAQKVLWLKVKANTIEIMDQEYHVIAVHPRLYGEQKESMIWEPYLKLMAKRPTALKYTGFFKELPTAMQDYFNKCSPDEKKKSLNILLNMVKNTDIQTASKAFEESLNRDLTDADSVLAIYNRITSDALDIKTLKLPADLPELEPFTPDVNAYDVLMKGGE